MHTHALVALWRVKGKRWGATKTTCLDGVFGDVVRSEFALPFVHGLVRIFLHDEPGRCSSINRQSDERCDAFHVFNEFEIIMHS